MRFWPEVHWSEGQFLRPHHFQAAFRQTETLRGAMLSAAQPFAWGFLSLSLTREAIENHSIEINSCELILRDGTLVKIPENCSLDPRDFKKAFDQASGPLDVYFGVPDLQVVRRNVQRPGETLEGQTPRYSIDVSERYDENTGENPQSVEVRRMRGAVFLGSEDRTGFSCVRLGRIERSAAGPKLLGNSVPPLVRMQAWPQLCAGTDSLYNDIRARGASSWAVMRQNGR